MESESIHKVEGKTCGIILKVSLPYLVTLAYQLCRCHLSNINTTAGISSDR